MAPSRLPSARRGFTLVELLIVVVIIGILSAAAVPAFANPRARANLSKVKSDLHHYAQAEEAYFHDHGTYTPSLALLGVQASEGVLLTPIEGTASGWSVRAVHPSADPVTCALYFGSAASVSPATEPGVIACR